MKLDILFIRHAFSCANAWGKKSKGSQWKYADPELTTVGIEVSEKSSNRLLDKLNELWGDNQYTIGASQMIRTQETAYYMLAKPTNSTESINIFPYIGEPGAGYDNWAFPREKQLQIMGNRNPDILKYFGLDKGKKQLLGDKSNPNMFINWATRNPSMFGKGSDKYYRAVIFTHSIFLKKWFGVPRIKNNNGIRMRLNTDGFQVEKTPNMFNPYSHTRTEYMESWEPIDIIGDLEVSNKCPDGCLKTSCSEPSSILEINVSNINQPFYARFGSTKKRGRTPRNIIGGRSSSLKAHTKRIR